MAGRPLEFDRVEALSRAVDAFWCHGYEGLPTTVLAKEMGVSKSSLYNTFGTKRELLIEAVAAYTNAKAEAIRQIAASQDLLTQMRTFLLDIVHNNDDGMGCLLVNTAAELGLHDIGVRQLLQSGFQSVSDAFELLVIAGQRSGEFKRDLDSTKAALMIVTTIAGLRVLAKAGVPTHQLATAIEHPLAFIAA
ncbi:TetR/AcrR family transcriptional regulator [Cupriavidus pinatubonensis]|uniref:HTH-type transcriptional repressor ComR n=1 Tax=Cupriavidus pinatubonensis TaxID=248026 RepID=A0ABN7Z419_9BURK|nr:TetR/AcrR family transcriptional regulator [Cupriavidus pinatubonensis]CAG9180729.1 HTH-type transcriptional repressor ComR [Cupriavidus pinatubonensis]